MMLRRLVARLIYTLIFLRKGIPGMMEYNAKKLKREMRKNRASKEAETNALIAGMLNELYLHIIYLLKTHMDMKEKDAERIAEKVCGYLATTVYRQSIEKTLKEMGILSNMYVS